MAFGRIQPCGYRGLLAFFASCIVSVGAGAARGGDVSGLVRMPEICSPSVSPAVVFLTPVSLAAQDEGAASANGKSASVGRLADLALVNQRGLQFVPRVQAIEVGQTIRFTNQDGETHNVHVVSPDYAFNQSMAPGQPRDFTPAHAGVMKLACDIHHHMRGFVVVSPTPWFAVCDRDGRFRMSGVAAGRYVLSVWHELGDPLRTDLNVVDGAKIEVPLLVLAVPVGLSGRQNGQAGETIAPVRPWGEVVDRISVMLAESRDAVMRRGEPSRARRLVDDAYWAEFEQPSEMETAIRKYIGYSAAGELERQFREIGKSIREVAAKRQSPDELVALCDRLIAELVKAARELDSKGVTDRSRIDAIAGPVAGLEAGAVSADDDPRVLLHALERGFRQIDQVAQRDGPDDAAAELTSVYMTDFEPLERYLLGRRPQEVRSLEIRFNRLRGDLSGGMRGEELRGQLDGLFKQVESLVVQLETQPGGGFGSAFLASFITIVREGVEVILILTMLLALVGKATTGSGLRDPGASSQTSAGPMAAQSDSWRAANRLRLRGVKAIWWGVAAAVLASIATAIALNRLIVSAPGAAREMLEGSVMLVAAAVLFYVSYWLISRFEAKRWTDYLAERARRGIELGGQGTLALTAFLAVYREGAETSLLYQALLGSEGRTRAGLLGLVAGVALGGLLLAIIAAVVKATSVRLPMQLFFKLSGIFLFVLAIVFAGNGVFELQNAGILITTNLSWMGRGLPWAGLFPNLQVLAVQGLLLFGAVAAWLLVPRLAVGLGAGKVTSVKIAAKRD